MRRAAWECRWRQLAEGPDEPDNSKPQEKGGLDFIHSTAMF